MSSFSLPTLDHGYLPLIILLEATLGLVHAITCYILPPAQTTAMYRGPNAPPPNTLLPHVYGLKNTYTTLIRVYAAYNIEDPRLYNLALCTFVGVLIHFSSEIWWYQNSRIQELGFSLGMCGVLVVWMIVYRGNYIIQVT